MADLDESAQDSLLDSALHTTKDDDAVLGDISGDPAVDDSLEDPVIIPFWFLRMYTCLPVFVAAIYDGLHLKRVKKKP